MRLAASAALAGLLAAGCAAGAGGGRAGVAAAPRRDVVQIDRPAPPLAEIGEEVERALARDAQVHASRGAVAHASGEVDEARAEAKQAAAGFLRLAERFPSSRWRLVYWRAAAELSRDCGDHASAAAAADLLRRDPDASPETRAVATRLAVGALHALAIQEVKAGTLPPLELAGAARRAPRTPPHAWKRVIEAADAYGALHERDPFRGAGRLAAALSLLAAQIELAHGNVEDARTRLEALFQRWPSTAAAVDGVAPYLETFAGQDGEYARGVSRARAMLEACQPRSAEAASAAGADDEQKAIPVRVASLLQRLRLEEERLAASR